MRVNREYQDGSMPETERYICQTSATASHPVRIPACKKSIIDK